MGIDQNVFNQRCPNQEKASDTSAAGSEPSFENIAYRYGFFKNLVLRVSDSIITNPVKRATRYLEQVESQADAMDKSIKDYLAEKSAITESISELRLSSVDKEQEVKKLLAEVDGLKNTVSREDLEIKAMSKDGSAPTDPARFTEYTEKKKEFFAKEEEYKQKCEELENLNRERLCIESNLRREEARLQDYQACVDELVKERAELERYISTISDTIKDEKNMRGIPVVRKIRGAK